jgi:type 1 glutamine amidotransferase
MPSRRFKGLLAVWVAASAACEGAPSEPGLPPDGGGQGASAGAAGTAGAASTASGGTAGNGGTAAGAAGISGGGAGNSSGAAGAAMSGGAAGDGAGGQSSGAAGTLAGLGGTAGAGGSAGASGDAGSSGTGGGSGTGGSSGTAGASGTAGGGGTAGSGNDRPARVLLYHFSTLDIPSVPQQLDILEAKLESWSYEVERSEDPAAFSDQNLERFAAVGMINTCFYPFGANNSTGDPEAQALQRFLQDGGGLFGTHCADVTFQSAASPVLYNRLLGGRASSEYFEGQSECRTDGEHATIAALPATFGYQGNLDNTNFIADDSQVLVRCTWGDAEGTDVAVSWVRMEGSGRVFFTGFGKVAADLSNETIGEDHILSGLAWVLSRSP